MAAVHSETGTCIRPMPYLTQTDCRQRGIFPGVRVSSRFKTSPEADKPHIEDVIYPTNVGLDFQSGDPLTFKKVLDLTLCDSVEEGFGGSILNKVNPFSAPAARSLITYKPSICSIVESVFNNEDKPKKKLRVHFDEFKWVPLNDLGYLLDFESNPDEGKVYGYNQFLLSQQDIYLRLGLGRKWVYEGRDGYWLQVNGIHTFPNSNPEVRRYV